VKALVFLFVFLLPLLAGNVLAKRHSTDAASMEQKLRHIESNGHAARPDQTPTVITEPEANAYLASDNVVLPDGVRSVKLVAQPGVITGTAQVDFDRIREGSHSSNPLLGIFTGVHEVIVVAHAYGAARQGYVHVDSVSLDGVEVPRFVLQLFVEKYLQPKYPELGLDSRFSLTDRVDTATVGEHKLTVTQK
jgi:hypothetical protein